MIDMQTLVPTSFDWQAAWEDGARDWKASKRRTYLENQCALDMAENLGPLYFSAWLRGWSDAQEWWGDIENHYPPRP